MVWVVLLSCVANLGEEIDSHITTLANTESHCGLNASADAFRAYRKPGTNTQKRKGKKKMMNCISGDFKL